jgi:cytochrome c553
MTRNWLGSGLGIIGIVALGIATLAAGCADVGSGTMPQSTGSGGDTFSIPSTLCNDPNNPNGSPNGGTKTGPGGVGMTGPAVPGGFSPFPPNFGTTTTQTVPPPAISGGTLRVLADGKTAVAADPDRDQVYVVDLAAHRLSGTIVLNPGDEPGRLVADAAGRVHVALRRGGALVSIDPVAFTVLSRRAACASPRGVAYDPGSDLVHVACADGQLVSLPAAGGDAVRTLLLERDLRDVVVDGPRLRVSRFRTAEILTVEADGSVSGRVTPTGFRAAAARGGQLYTASVAYKMEEMPDGSGVMVLHQRGVVDPVQPVVGGYGGPDACNGIVHPAVTSVSSDGTVVKSGPALAGMVLAVDMAISHDGNRVAIVSAGNSTNSFQGDTQPDLTQVFVSTVDATTDTSVGCQSDGMHGPCQAGSSSGILLASDGNGGTSGTAGSAGTAGSFGTAGTGGGTTCGVPDPSVPQVVGQPIAVAFDGNDGVVVQSREPAMLALANGVTIGLSPVVRKDTGHLVFHSNAGGFLACASCHAEGNDDGRTWQFACEGTRRTQSLQTGLRGTEPFHWSGDEHDFTQLMNDVFMGRMSGPLLPADQSDALLTWIDAQPRPLRTAPADGAAVARGQALFQSPTAACATCHAGAKFTNALTVDVGTGGMFQVPSLVGVGTRGPFMHNGCAGTLSARFSDPTCGGGDRHGGASTLSPDQLSDLLAYLDSI